MGNKIVTEADRKRTLSPDAQRRDPGHPWPWPAREPERGVATRSKKNPGKRSKKGG